MRLFLCGLAAIVLAGSAGAGEVPNPINAPASVTANHMAGWTAAKPQQAADLGLNGYYYGGTTAGTANAQTLASVAPTGFALTTGVMLQFQAGATNTSTATLNAGSTSAVAVDVNTAGGLTALAGGEIVSGNRYTAVYNGTVWVLTNPSSPVPVPQGGTGLATLTAHDVYVGAGTSAPTAIAGCTNGALFWVAATSDPVCSTGPPFAGNLRAGLSLTVGSTSMLGLATGELGLVKQAASGTAPGASGLKLAVVCGTGAGSAKIVAYAGTSTTPVTISDNIGSGVTGC